MLPINTGSLIPDIMKFYQAMRMTESMQMIIPPIQIQPYWNFLINSLKLKGKVGVFGAWEAFNRILNEQRSGIPVIAAYDTCGGAKPNANELMINKLLRDSQKHWAEECFDVFTHHAAMEYLKKERPKVMYIAYGETDEWRMDGNINII